MEKIKNKSNQKELIKELMVLTGKNSLRSLAIYLNENPRSMINYYRQKTSPTIEQVWQWVEIAKAKEENDRMSRFYAWWTYTVKGRRISNEEFMRIQAKFEDS